MKSSRASFGKFLLVAYLLAIHALAGFFVYERFYAPYFSNAALQAVNVGDPTEKTEVPTPQPIPSIFAEEIETEPSQTNANQSLDYTNPDAAGEKLMIPVVGVKREQIRDTYNDARSNGRVHNANDIMAPGGAAVVACTDGEIAKFFDSVRGGITIYQYSRDRKFVYYYAHLQKRADNLKEGDFVRQGTVIGYVGDTGNSGAGNYHLHFAVTILADPKNVFKGTDVNPYPLLKEGIEAR